MGCYITTYNHEGLDCTNSNKSIILSVGIKKEVRNETDPL